MSLRFPAAKDPSDVTWWELDCAGELADGDTIASVTWTVPVSLTIVSQSVSGSTARVKLSGGTVGLATLTADITTTAGETMQRTVLLQIKDL